MSTITEEDIQNNPEDMDRSVTHDDGWDDEDLDTTGMDRGDVVDSSMPEDDDDFDPDAGQQQPDPDSAGQQQADPQGKPKDIPYPRFSDMVGQRNSATQRADAATQRAEAAEALLRQYQSGELSPQQPQQPQQGQQQAEDAQSQQQGQQQAPEAAQDALKALEDRLDDLDIKREEALLDGDLEKSRQYLKEYRAVNRDYMAAHAQLQEQAREARDQARQAQNAQQQEEARQKSVIADYEREFSQLNPESADYDGFTAAQVNSGVQHFMGQGKTFDEALNLSVQRVMGTAPKAQQQAHPMQANLERAGRIPPIPEGGKGERAMDMAEHLADMDDDKFDAIPEEERRRLRGDFVGQ